MPVSITTSGFIEVYRGGVFVSRHTVETKAVESAVAHSEEFGDGDYDLRFPSKKLVSRLGKSVIPFSWNTITARFDNGTASTVGLSSFLSNPTGKTITYSAVDSLPAGVTIAASTGVLSYNGTGVAATASVRFRATWSIYTAESPATTVEIRAVQVENQPPVWSGTDPITLAPITVGQGGSYSLLGYVSDTDGPNPLTFGRSGGAADTAPGTITVSTAGQLTVPQVSSIPAGGGYTVEVYADDGYGVAPGVGITDATQVIPLHSRPRPGAGGFDYDPTFGATIERVTVQGATGLSSASAYFWQIYSQLPTWNSNGTLMIVEHNQRPAMYEDTGTAYVVRRGDIVTGLPGSNNGWRWSPTEPYVFYYLGWSHNVTGVTWPAGSTPHAGAVFCKATFNTSTWLASTEVVAHWPQYARLFKNPSYESIKVSTAGELWVGLCGETTADAGPYWAFALNITQSIATAANVETSHLDLSPAAAAWNAIPSNQTNPSWPITVRDPDNVTLTPRCDKISIQWGADPLGSGTRWYGQELFDIDDWTFLKQTQRTGGHHDHMIGPDGVQYTIYYDNNSGIFKSDLDSVAVSNTRLIDWQARTAWRMGIHVSGQHGQRTGSPFAVISADVSAAGTLVPFEQEVLLLYLDSTPTVPHVLRICQTANSIGRSPLACISFDGSKIAFGSDWRAADGITGDVYVVGVPS